MSNAPAEYEQVVTRVWAQRFLSGTTLDSEFTGCAADGTFRYTEDGTLLINTLQGVMEAADGDYVVRGNGEFYPVRPDIFERTHQRATD